LILTVPLTTKYETGHWLGGLLHLCIAVGFLMRLILEDTTDTTINVYVAIQLVVIYALHIMPICVQRLNRARLYNAIEATDDKILVGEIETGVRHSPML
jgi:hypothetical protein